MYAVQSRLGSPKALHQPNFKAIGQVLRELDAITVASAGVGRSSKNRYFYLIDLGEGYTPSSRMYMYPKDTNDVCCMRTGEERAFVAGLRLRR